MFAVAALLAVTAVAVSSRGVNPKALQISFLVIEIVPAELVILLPIITIPRSKLVAFGIALIFVSI